MLVPWDGVTLEVRFRRALGTRIVSPDTPATAVAGYYRRSLRDQKNPRRVALARTAEGGCPHVADDGYTKSSTFNFAGPPFHDAWKRFCTKAAS